MKVKVKGRCQRSRLVQINIKSKMPNYRPLEERKSGQRMVERGGARKKCHFLRQSYLIITSSISEIKIQLNSIGHMYKTILFVPNI